MIQELELISKEVRKILANIRDGDTQNSKLLASIHDRLDNLADLIETSGSLIRSHFVSFYESVENYDMSPSSPSLRYVDQMAKPFLSEVKRLTDDL